MNICSSKSSTKGRGIFLRENFFHLSKLMNTFVCSMAERISFKTYHRGSFEGVNVNALCYYVQTETFGDGQ